MEHLFNRAGNAPRVGILRAARTEGRVVECAARRWPRVVHSVSTGGKRLAAHKTLNLTARSISEPMPTECGVSRKLLVE